MRRLFGTFAAHILLPLEAASMLWVVWTMAWSEGHLLPLLAWMPYVVLTARQWEEPRGPWSDLRQSVLWGVLALTFAVHPIGGAGGTAILALATVNASLAMYSLAVLFSPPAPEWGEST